MSFCGDCTARKGSPIRRHIAPTSRELIQRNAGRGRPCHESRMELEADEDLKQCVDAMIERHGRRAAEVAQRFADLNFILDEPETGGFWAVLACMLRRRLRLLT
jgi:hypothetical protein